MILIAAKTNSPRLEYIAEIIFKEILNTDFKVITIEAIKDWVEKYPAASIIYYSNEITYGSGSFVIPYEGLLFEENIIKKEPGMVENPYLQLHFSKNNWEGFTFPFDLFSAAFYLITEYEKYADPKFDSHGRYDEEQYALYKNHYHNIPVLHEYAEAIWDQLKVLNPMLIRQICSFDYTITFDIDAPYLYKGRGFALQVAGLAKEILTFRCKRLLMRLKAYISGNDPYNVYDYLLSKCNPAKLIFFFLIDRHSPFDGRYIYKSPLYRRLIESLKSKGLKIGIHPSYTAYNDPSKIIFEKEKLEEIIKDKVTLSRMHFLKYKLPDTYRYLQLAGIKDDYTACPVNTPGFKNFIAVPFRWFDLEKNMASDIRLHPTMVMDSTLQKYMHKGTDEALVIIKDFITSTQKYKGHFILLLHNSTLSGEPGWKGWRQVFEETMLYLKT